MYLLRRRFLGSLGVVVVVVVVVTVVTVTMSVRANLKLIFKKLPAGRGSRVGAMMFYQIKRL